MPASVRMPTWFIPHGGGPCFFMDWNPPGTWARMEAWLRSVGMVDDSGKLTPFDLERSVLRSLTSAETS